MLIVLFNLKPKENTEPFSLNMIDDVIHDKYEKNTDEYYKYRITRDENSLKTNSWSLILYDNLAVAYDHIWNLEKALAYYKTKKELMENSKYDMQNWYRYYANLGTFLIHDWLKGWFKNKSDKKSQDKVIEWKGYIEKAIAININAHFWRENYQLVANKWLISAFSNPDLLITENLLWKKSIDDSLFTADNSWTTCWKKYYEFYPATKKIGKTTEEQIEDSCPMALKWIIWMIRYWWWPSPFSYASIGDILTAMWEYRLAFASYARAVKMKHANSEKIIIYSKKLAKNIYPELSENEAYVKLLSQFKADYKIWNDWSNAYIEYQKKIIKEWKDPLLSNSYDEFYKEFKKPNNV